MQVKALLFDFRVFAPIEINYQKAFEALARESKPRSINPLSKDFFGQISLVLAEKKKSQRDYKEFVTKMSELLDEIESAQIGNFHLYPGVKNGLGSLKTMKLSVAATTELGTNAAEKFLKDNEIKAYIGELVPRIKIESAGDLGLRIKSVLEKVKAKSDECIYFCNRLEDLNAAKSKKVATIVLPSKGSRMDAILRENPDGMIMTLEELPAMLSLEKFKKPVGKEGETVTKRDLSKRSSS